MAKEGLTEDKYDASLSSSILDSETENELFNKLQGNVTSWVPVN